MSLPILPTLQQLDIPIRILAVNASIPGRSRVCFCAEWVLLGLVTGSASDWFRLNIVVEVDKFI
jgi:hypothetical protein